MPDHASIIEGEAIVEGEIAVDCRGSLRSVFAQGGYWKAQIEFPLSSGGFQRVCLPLRQVKQVLKAKVST